MRERKRRLWHPTPYDGQPGFFNAWLRFFYQFEGTADLGDPNEPPYVPPADPRCPICSQPMKDHLITRGGPGKYTHMSCPPAAGAEGDGIIEGDDSASTPETTETAHRDQAALLTEKDGSRHSS